MKGNNTVILLVLAVAAFFLLKGSFTVSKTVGVTTNTSNMVSNIIAGLSNIFGSTESAYSGGDISAPEGMSYSTSN